MGDGVDRYDVLIVGSGFSGSILAAVLAGRGRRVLLVDRARHPRFALGESTTPLANLALERLAERHDLPGLYDLATHGRLTAEHPELGVGLKRGFSFYLEVPGSPLAAGAERRLLVAASPEDRIADTHWLRSDVDRHLVGLAVESGATVRQGVELADLEEESGGWRVTLRSEATDVVSASVLVDASGGAAAVARRLGVGPGTPLQTASGLLYGHFRGVAPLAEAVPELAPAGATPYPEDRAAVHHLLEEGWLYLLRFDDGLTSAGLLVDLAAGTAGRSLREEAWESVLARYPTLAALFAGSRPERAVASLGRLQRRLSRAAGPRWVALPHTYGFVDPLFSVGLAWSLRAVERLAEILLAEEPAADGFASGAAFVGYAARLEREIEQVDRLVSTAYRCRRDLALFAAHAMLYFARVSFDETRERLGASEPWWEGFLGAGDASYEGLLRESARWVDSVLAGERTLAAYEDWIEGSIEPFNVAGLADRGKGNLYPADPADLVAAAGKLGSTPAEVEALLLRLLAG